MLDLEPSENVMQCNQCYVNLCRSVFVASFCLKGEALDGKSEAVIDYTPYLKFTQR